PMRSLWRASLVVGLAAMMLAVLAPSPAHAQAKTKEVSFETADGVTLKGAFYPAGGKAAKDGNPVVLFLHDFDHKKGGGSRVDGWGDLAKLPQANGYAVLSFDFRGFGDSKDVNMEVFWDARKTPHNVNPQTGIKNSRAASRNKDFTLDHNKDFTPGYYAYL